MTSHESETPRPRRADARRNLEAILVAAERCLSRDPDASMNDIAAEAGLGRVTVYGHFKSRSDLIEAVVHRVLGAADEALRDVDVGGDAAAALARLVEATWEVTVRSGSVLVAAEKALPANKVRQAHAGSLEKRVRDLIVRGQRSGDFRSDVPADWLVATVHAIVHAAANEIDAGRLDDGRASSIMATTIVGACAAPPDPDSTSVSRRRRSRSSTSGTTV